MATRFRLNFEQIFGTSAQVLAGGTLTFAISGGAPDQLQAIYQDDALTVTKLNPVTLDSAGKHGDIFLQAKDYRVIVKDAAGIVQPGGDVDPVHGGLDGAVIVNAGAALVTATSGNTARSLADHFGDVLNVLDFGAVPDNTTDCLAAFQAGYTAAQTAGKALIVPGGGTYKLSGPWTISHSNMQILALGKPVLHFTGAGKCVVIDGGAAGNGINNVTFGGPGQFDIKGNASATDGIYMRAAHRCRIRAKVRDISEKGLHTQFVIMGTVEIICSVNVDAMTTVPTYGLYLDARTGSEHTELTFIDPILEIGPASIGIACNYTKNCVFLGGTSEGNIKGFQDTANSLRTQMVGTWFEANVQLDAEIYGTGNLFSGCRFGSAGSSGNGCVELVQAKGTIFSGGWIRNVDRQANSKDTGFFGVGFNKDSTSAGNQGTGSFRLSGCHLTDVNEVWFSSLDDTLGVYTVATLPTYGGTAGTAGLIYVSNESGGAVPAFYDGTNWRRVTDRAIVS